MKTVGLVVKPDDDARRKADEFERWLADRQVAVVRYGGMMPPGQLSCRPAPSAPGDLACIFVLGGDGTFLSAVRWVGGQPIPILGVKFGEVGFLAETVADQLFAAAEAILDNRYITQSRMRLQVVVYREQRQIADETVLNDVVINKGALARLASVVTDINGHYLTTFKADGLIVATPTGSTAYSLAAGGPVVHPEVPGILITPISPFTLTNRPLLIPDSAEIMLRLEKKSEDIMLTFDGQTGLPIDSRDQIRILKSPHPIHLVTLPEQQYFDVLKAKLSWSGGRV